MDAQKIETEAMELLKDLSKALETVREQDATHYVVDMNNVFRQDGEPVSCEGFQNKLKGLAPRFRDGFIVAEKGSD